MKKIFLFLLIALFHINIFGQVINDFNPPAKITKPLIDTIEIDPLSSVSIYLEGIKKLYGRDQVTGSATGFILEENSKYYLITNWHVITNRNPADSTANLVKVKNKDGTESRIDIADPEKIRVYFHGKELGTWIPTALNLYEEGKKKWLEHPLGRRIDVVALPLNFTKDQKDEISLYSINFEDYNDDIVKYPSINLSIIGFPLGFSSFGRFPIWKTGQLASDFDLNFDNLPVFLIDAATRGGMSGSPVIIRQRGATYTRNSFGMGGQVQQFLGVYSGRLPGDSDIGIVWKVKCLEEIIR